MKVITCHRCGNMDTVFSSRQKVCNFCKEERKRNRGKTTKIITKDRAEQIKLLREWGVYKCSN